MLRMGQKHGGQRLLSKSIGQLRHLDCGACVICGAIRPRRCSVGDTFQDRRQHGHQDGHQDVAHGGDPLDDSPLPNCSIRNIVLADRDKQLLSELRRASAMALPRCVVTRYATTWAESLEGAMSTSPGPCFAATDAAYSSLKPRKVSTETPS